MTGVQTCALPIKLMPVSALSQATLLAEAHRAGRTWWSGGGVMLVSSSRATTSDAPCEQELTGMEERQCCVMTSDPWFGGIWGLVVMWQSNRFEWVLT